MTTAPARGAPSEGAVSKARTGGPDVRWTWLVITLLCAVLAAAASVALGIRAVGWHDILAGMTGTPQSIAEAAVHKRVPRTLLALLVGAALGTSGALMQGVTRNPMGDPGILGVTSGSALFVVSGIAFAGLHHPVGYIVLAVTGAAVAGAFVYAVGSLGPGGATPLKLTLAGAATSAACTSTVSAILLPRVDVMTQFRFWQIGGVGGARMDRIALVLPVVALGAALALAASRGLNSLALGDDLAAGLGEHVTRTRLLGATAAVLLAGAATAVAGPIGFVGLVVPHLCRLLIGPDHRWLLPFSMLVGAALLTVADVVGRLVARPEEIDVGIVTALLGAPVFIVIVRRTRVRAL